MENPITVPQPKRIMLPILVVLFLISYGLLALLVVEQGRTIDSQRNLIRDIFSDSSQLNAMKMAAIRKQRQNQIPPNAQAPSSQATAPSSQSRPNGSQSGQSPAAQLPQSDKAKHGSATKLRKLVPQKPPMAASDSSDIRRNVAHI
jgi:hypothetical protein